MDLPDEDTALMVVSTTGDGEEPDNMKQAWRFLLRKSLPAGSLNRLRFGLFGLGDSSYPKFNAVARRLQVMNACYIWLPPQQSRSPNPHQLMNGIHTPFSLSHLHMSDTSEATWGSEFR